MGKPFISQNIGKETSPYSIQLYNVEGSHWEDAYPFKNVVRYNTSDAGHQPWGQNAHYSLVKEMGSPISLKPQLTYFTFTAICGIKVGGIEIHDMDNIGRVNVTIRNIDTNEIETHNDVDCYLVMSSSWGFVTAVSLPKWENVEINFEVFSAEMRI